MTSKGWLDQERTGIATGRILDAAEDLYQEFGVQTVTMEDVAKAAGCSRATVYRYFDDRVALRTAYVHRETRRVAAGVAQAISSIADPAERVVEAITQTVAAVRRRPALHAWFTARNAEVTAELVKDSAVIRGVAATLFEGDADGDRLLRATWLVRITMSFLLFPASTEEEELVLLTRFVGSALAG